jgi:DNA modification methylase
MGAGTTALAAEQLGRNSIGCELSPDYIRLAEARLHEAAPLLGSVT